MIGEKTLLIHNYLIDLEKEKKQFFLFLVSETGVKVTTKQIGV